MKARLTRLKQAILNNKGLKIFALILAIVIWYFIPKETPIEKVLTNVPVRILVDEGWAIHDQSANTVEVMLRGSLEDMLNLRQEYTKVEIDIRGLPYEGPFSVDLLPRNVKGLAGPRPIHIKPDSITLSLDQEGEVKVPVKPLVQGELPEGYEVEKVVAREKTVTMYGPRLRLQEIDSVKTAPIDLEGRLRSFSLRMPVVSPSDSWVARIEPEKVFVDVTIVERASTRTLENLPVSALVEGDRNVVVSLSPATVNVVLKGRSALMEKLVPDELRVFVDCTSLQPGSNYELPIQVHTPDGMAVETVDPDSLKVGLNPL